MGRKTSSGRRNQLLSKDQFDDLQCRARWKDCGDLPLDDERLSDYAALLEAIVRELELREDLNQLIEDGCSEQSKEVCRAWWAAVEVLLEQYIKSLRLGGPKTMPASILSVLSRLAGYLAKGRVPPPIECARKGRGSPEFGPTEMGYIRWAVAYKRASKDGRIADRQSTKTILDEFGIKKRTAQIWAQKYEPSEGSLQMSGPAVKRKMRNAALNFRAATRSSEAISGRGYGRI